MNEDSIAQYITETFKGVKPVVAWDVNFFFYNPEPEQPDTVYFATLKSSDDEYDSSSNLNRPSVFRLNIGVGKNTYRSLFGMQTSPLVEGEVIEAGLDYATLDHLLPHPVYGRQYWVCILNPSDATFQEKLVPLLKEAYDLAVSKYERRTPRKSNVSS